MNGRDARSPRPSAARSLATLSLGALGIVFGDIGTSPLYAVKACFGGAHGIGPSAASVLGLLSMVFWSLTLVIGGKYCAFVMRADNHGAGGVLALVALLKRGNDDASPPPTGRRASLTAAFVIVGLFGAALLYSEAVITPVVSVLGAVEGLGGTTHGLSTSVLVAISIAILVGLFAFQKHGTARVGAVFGPLMLVWFATIGALGAYWIAKRPDVLVAIDPRYALAFFRDHFAAASVVLGAVVLCITGAEALSTDMSHFGKTPIRLAWLFVAFPALLANYFGQGAVLLDAQDHGAAALAQVSANPFYAMAGDVLRYPLIGIATAAAIIASQALISGAFSLTQSAVQLGFWPRVTIKHTSTDAEGQIYVPEVNTALMVGCIVLVLAFGESTRIAPAYGLAVTGTMTITSVLFYGVARRWGWSRPVARTLVLGFLALDLAFFGASAHKLFEGGGVSLLLGAALFVLMTTWHAGRARLNDTIKRSTLPLDLFLDLGQKNPHRVRGTLRVSGTAVFLTSNTDGAPPALLHYLKHHKVLHERVIILSIVTRHVPEVALDERIDDVVDLGLNVYQVIASYGFMQTPNVLETVEACRRKGLAIDTADTSYFLGRETLVLTDAPGMARWRKLLFSCMSRNARPANTFFRIPSNRVVELGTHVEL